MSTAYQALLEKFRTIAALKQASGLIGWDQEVMMPPLGGNMRAEQLKALSLVIHEKLSAPEIGDLLEKAEETAETAPHLREIKRQYREATRIPAKLVGEFAATTSRAQMAWQKARSANDFAGFAPILNQVVNLSRERGKCLAENGSSPYDALLDEYEPGMSAARLDSIFDGLIDPLVSLSAHVMEKPVKSPLSGEFPVAAQKALAEKVLAAVGMSNDWSRLDKSAHPFSSGHFDDCRITIRHDEADPFGAIYSALHEAGHALYEHGISRDLQLLPAGVYCSMGIHESQSRFVENQIGRSRAFCNWLYPQFSKAFDNASINSAEALYHAVNHVERGFIRTEADEVHYNLHVILRYRLEQQLFNGSLEVDNLEAAWNEAFEKMFSLKVTDAANGVLQDIHWSFGAFGYFPTYALGNIYSACLAEAITQDIPSLNDEVEAGNHAGWREWMQTRIHRHGRLKTAAELIEAATGNAPSADPLTNYLNHKFS